MVSTPAASGESGPMMAMPTTMEFILPPILGVVLIISGLLFLMIPAQWRRYKKKRQRANVTAPTSLTDVLELGGDLSLQKQTLLTQGDIVILEDMNAFFNKPMELVVISLPSIISLALCPFLLYTYKHMIEYFWPPYMFTSGIPNINDALACFLVPAGLVYAVTFGFTFQASVEKQNAFTNNLILQVSLLDQMLHLASQMKTDSVSKIKVYRAVKDATLGSLLEIQNRSNEKTSTRSLWKVIGYVREACENNEVDKIIMSNIMDNVLKINTASSQIKEAISSKIHPLQWIFLLALSFFSFFGILLIQSQSKRMDLCMCIVTVFSITILTYVNADLDSPFSGFFRVDISALTDVIKRVDEFYKKEVDMEDEVVISKLSTYHL
ncbi:uncharacterized protein LOC144436576 [Glandiceps talaboti]